MSQQTIDDFIASAPSVAAALAKVNGGAPETASPEKLAELLVSEISDRALFVQQTIEAYRLL